MKANNRKREVRGFTLMEMILVLAVIGILLGMAAYSMRDVWGDAETARAKADIKTLETNLVRYRTLSQMLPTTEQGLDALVEKPTTAPIPGEWKSLIGPNALIDPWGSPYQYLVPGNRSHNGFDIYSLGKDRVESEDDIGNWDK